MKWGFAVMGGVQWPPGPFGHVPDAPQVSLEAIVGVQVLQVIDLVIANLRSGFHEGIFGTCRCVCAFRDTGGAIVSVMLLLALAVVVLHLWSS